MLAGLRHGPRFLLDHRFTMRHASSFVSGELAAPAEHRVERHARLCPACREAIASLRRMLRALGTLRRADAPEDPAIADAVMERLRTERLRR